MNDPAIKNLEFLRQLIAAARAAEAGTDMERLRMMRYPNAGTSMITAKQEDR